VKTSKDGHTLSAVQIFGRDLVSGDVRFVRKFGRFSRKETLKDSGVAR